MCQEIFKVLVTNIPAGKKDKANYKCDYYHERRNMLSAM